MFLVNIERNDEIVVSLCSNVVCFIKIILNDTRFLCGRMFAVGPKTLHNYM